MVGISLAIRYIEKASASTLDIRSLELVSISFRKLLFIFGV